MAAKSLALQVGVAPACRGLGVPRATFYRRHRVSGQTRTYLRLLVQSVWWRVVRVMPESGGQGVMGES